MLFWLKKVATPFFLPLTFSLIAAFAAVLCLAFRRERASRRLFLASFVVLALASNKGVSTRLARPLEIAYPPIPEVIAGSPVHPSLQACRAVLVLGGGHARAEDRARLSQLSASAVFRLTEGMRIARQLPDAKLVVSGWAGERGVSHAQILAEAAESLGFPRDRIICFHTPRDTEEEAREAANRYAGESVALVTSAFHMTRAVGLFRRANVTPVPCPTDFQARDVQPAASDWLQWDLGSLERSTRSIRERVGQSWNWVRGRG